MYDHRRGVLANGTELPWTKQLQSRRLLAIDAKDQPRPDAVHQPLLLLPLLLLL
jgi:hypothetical protein